MVETVGYIRRGIGKLGPIVYVFNQAKDGKPWILDGSEKNWMAVSKVQGDPDTNGIAINISKWILFLFLIPKNLR